MSTIKNNIFIQIICISILSLPLSLHGKEWQTESRSMHYNGRVLNEFCHISSNGDIFYSYTVNDISNRIDSIKETKRDVMSITKYPIWHDHVRTRREQKENTFLCHSYFTHSDNYVFDIKVLIDDTGKVLCYKILSKESLIISYSTEELMTLFDKISRIRFSVPVFKIPESNGYCLFSLW